MPWSPVSQNNILFGITMNTPVVYFHYLHIEFILSKYVSTIIVVFKIIYFFQSINNVTFFYLIKINNISR